MLSPLDLLKSYFTFQSYFAWFFLASFLFSGFLFIKKKYHHTHTTTWKGYLIYFLIIVGIFSFVYLCFFYKPKVPSSKYVSELINEIDKAIDKYDQTINDYKGLKSDWEGELKKCEKELKTLYEKQELTQEQKEKIKKFLSKNEENIKEIKEQLKETSGNIEILKGKLIDLEKQKTKKEKEIKKTEEQIKDTNDQTEKQKLQKRLEELCKKNIELVKKISYIRRDIGILESKQKMYEGMMFNAIKLRGFLERQYYDMTSKEQTLFGKIKTLQERKEQIQKNIDEIKQKLKEIETEQDLYKVLKEKYREMHNRLITYEKENSFSFGNTFKFGFKAFDRVTDLIPAKFGIKTLGKTISVTRKYAQGMGKATLVLHEGHRLWHMYNEVANKNKESSLMLTKESLDSYINDIERDLAKLDTDQKDYEKKKEEYILEQDNPHLINEIDKEHQQEEKIIERKRIVIDEYQKIVFELDEKSKQIADIPHLKENEYDFNLQLEKVKEEKKLVEEELYKELNPNYNRVQQRIQQKRQTKIPEMVMIPNK